MNEDIVEETDAAGEDQELFEHHRFVVDKGQDLLRIDKFLMHKLSNATRTKVQQGIEAGNVLVNAKEVKSNYKVKPADIITVVFAHPPREIEIIPENIPLNIVFEDESLVIVNKPPGLVVHPGYGNYKGTLVNALVYHFQNLPDSKTNPKLAASDIKESNSDIISARPGLVHRIDKNTSGLLVVAKTELAMTKLAKEFFDHTIDRTYLALVWGDMEQEEGTITGHIGRSVKDRKIFTVYADGSEGKHAVTHYKVLERFGYVTLIQCKLETGRTHQIRVHMRYIKHPIFNDSTYGGDSILKGTVFARYRQFVENCFELMPRHGLHAKSLGFKHPVTKKKLLFDSELPPDMQAVIEKWRKYAQHKGFEEEGEIEHS